MSPPADRDDDRREQDRMLARLDANMSEMLRRQAGFETEIKSLRTEVEERFVTQAELKAMDRRLTEVEGVWKWLGRTVGALLIVALLSTIMIRGGLGR